MIKHTDPISKQKVLDFIVKQPSVAIRKVIMIELELSEVMCDAILRELMQENKIMVYSTKVPYFYKVTT